MEGLEEVTGGGRFLARPLPEIGSFHSLCKYNTQEMKTLRHVKIMLGKTGWQHKKKKRDKDKNQNNKKKVLPLQSCGCSAVKRDVEDSHSLGISHLSLK